MGTPAGTVTAARLPLTVQLVSAIVPPRLYVPAPFGAKLLLTVQLVSVAMPLSLSRPPPTGLIED